MAKNNSKKKEKKSRQTEVNQKFVQPGAKVSDAEAQDKARSGSKTKGLIN